MTVPTHILSLKLPKQVQLYYILLGYESGACHQPNLYRRKHVRCCLPNNDYH
jgi:hypothetical protein